MQIIPGKTNSPGLAVRETLAQGPRASVRFKAFLKQKDGNWFLRWTLISVIFGFITGPPIGCALTYFRSGHLFYYAATQVDIARAIFLYAIFGATMCFGFLVIFGVPARYLSPALREYPKMLSLPVQTLLVLVGALLMFTLRQFLLWTLLGVPSINQRNLWISLTISMGVTLVIAIVVGGFAKLRADVKQAEKLLYESKLNEQVLAERTANAQLRALQAQINPHFFFNTLSSIATLLNLDASAAR